jgi:hypothetical protein
MFFSRYIRCGLRRGQKKAAEVAKGRKFKISSLVVHDNETDIGGWPTKSRSVSGTITLID